MVYDTIFQRMTVFIVRTLNRGIAQRMNKVDGWAHHVNTETAPGENITVYKRMQIGKLL